MDLNRTRDEFLESQRHLYLTREVEYARGSDTVTLYATVGRTIYEETDESGTIIRSESRDYLIRAADLELDGTLVEPAPGDKITEESRVYEVFSIGSEPCWRWSDSTNSITYRVHAKRVS